MINNYINMYYEFRRNTFIKITPEHLINVHMMLYTVENKHELTELSLILHISYHILRSIYGQAF